jgi:hypothetical protein
MEPKHAVVQSGHIKVQFLYLPYILFGEDFWQ